MARIEWTRYSGDEVEAAVGMLICSMYPNAVRVRPSQGDGGIDVFVPGPAGFGRERAVYQIKKYADNLTSTQKRAIKRSYEEVIKTADDEGWRITEWHLVMPLDLTDRNLGWLDTLLQGAAFPCEIHGLLFCDTQAANYPKVIDYYFRDGRDRLEAAISNMVAVVSGRQTREMNEPMVPADVMSDLEAIYKALNACDPFYKYEFSASDSPPSLDPPPDVPGLVAVHAVQRDAVWITIKVKALSLAALEEQPIRGHFRIALPANDEELRDQFEKFVDYGAPLAMPAGTVSGSLDLPGGLGGELSGASLRVLSVPRDGEDDDRAELSLAIVAPDSDAVLAFTTIKRTELSVGQTGVRSVFSEKSGLFTLEMLVKAGRLTQGQMSRRANYNLAGRIPSEVVEGLKVLAVWGFPNRLAFGRSYGPPDYGIVATDAIECDSEAARWAPIAESLADLQAHVGTRLKMPSELTARQAASIEEASQLMSGEPVNGTMSDSFTVFHEVPPEIDREFDRVYEFMVIKRIGFELSGADIEVGKQALFFLGRYVRIEESESEIQPVSDGTCILYTGEAEITRVAVRDFRGQGEQ